MPTDEVSVTDYNGLTLTEATVLQNSLRERLDLNPLEKPIRTIAGADISLELHSEVVYAGIVILNFDDLQPIAYSLVKGISTFRMSRDIWHSAKSQQFYKPSSKSRQSTDRT